MKGEVNGMKNRLTAVVMCICLVLSMACCTAAGETAAGLVEVEYKKADLDASWTAADAVTITFGGAQAEIGGSGAQLSGNVLTISGKGDYLLSGEFSGRIVVDADKDDKVRLILNGLRLTSTDSAAIFIRKADKATVTLADGSENTIVAGANLLVDGDEALDAAVYSKADLVINGGGSLNVDSPNGHGILSKDDLRLFGGVVTVDAWGDGICGRDAVQMKGGTVSVVAGGDGVKANNDEDAERGYVSIDGGELTVSAGEDGIQAETALQIMNGAVNIEKSYEGIEAQYMLIAGGTLRVTASEDGLNAAGGDDESAQKNPFAAGHQTLEFAGGVTYINASGDGVDSNGAISFKGGEVYVSGPTGNGNGALDSSGDMTISGGILLAAGSAGMASAPSADGQAVTMIYADASQPGGAKVSVRNAAGEELASFTPEKEWISLVVSVPGISEGEEIQLYVNDALVSTATAGEGAGGGMHGKGGWKR